MGLLKGEGGQDRTLYSIRHTYYNLKLLTNNIDIRTIAGQMGSGAAMTERHFSKLTPILMANRLAHPQQEERFNMKKVVLASLVSASIATNAFAADAKNFEGFSVGANANLISAGAKAALGDYTLDSLGGKQSQSVALEASYGLKLSNDSILTVGVDYDVMNPTIGSVTYPDGEVTETIKLKQKTRYGIYLAPGYAVNNDTLLYAKLSYNAMKGEATNGDGSESANFTGIGWGAGAKVMLNKTTFLKVEAARVSYGSKTFGTLDFKPSVTIGSIGVGFNF